MIKKNFIFLLVIPALFLFGCANKKSNNSQSHLPNLKNTGSYTEVKIFFTRAKDPENITLVSIKKKIKNDESITETALKELLLGPTTKEQKKGVRTEIPIGTRLLKIEESNDDILIDLSGQFLTGGGAASVQLRYLQLYQTLKNIAPNKKVFLHIDGKPAKTIAGEGLEVSQPLEPIEDYTKKFEKTDEQP